MRRAGLEMLGTMVGSATARRECLRTKIATEIARLASPGSLPLQHALLLLLYCLQQNFRNSNRPRRWTTAEDWNAQEEGLWEEVKRIRGRLVEDDSREANVVGQRNFRHLKWRTQLSFSNRACCAYAYAADRVLRRIR